MSARILKTAPALAATALALAGLLALPAGAQDKPAMPDSVLKFPVKDIDGKPIDLAKYKGEVVLIVNVASKCGFDPAVHGPRSCLREVQGQGPRHSWLPRQRVRPPGARLERRDQGVLQLEIQRHLPDVLQDRRQGRRASPRLYQYLTSKETDPKFAGPIAWNFAKFLVNRKGEVIGRFDPRDKPGLGEGHQGDRGRLSTPLK